MGLCGGLCFFGEGREVWVLFARFPVEMKGFG